MSPFIYRKRAQSLGPDEPAMSEEIREQALVTAAFATDALLAMQATARVGYHVADDPPAEISPIDGADRAGVDSCGSSGLLM